MGTVRRSTIQTFTSSSLNPPSQPPCAPPSSPTVSLVFVALNLSKSITFPFNLSWSYRSLPLTGVTPGRYVLLYHVSNLRCTICRNHTLPEKTNNIFFFFLGSLSLVKAEKPHLVTKKELKNNTFKFFYCVYTFLVILLRSVWVVGRRSGQSRRGGLSHSKMGIYRDGLFPKKKKIVLLIR